MKNNIPIYLISLKSDTNRRKVLEKNFLLKYKDFIHIEAVDGRKLNAKEYYEQTVNYFLRTKKIMTPSELGCTLSHINALKSFLETESDYALILEDDVIGNDEDINYIYLLANELNKNSLFICGGQDGLAARKYLYGKKEISNVYKLSKFSQNHVLRTCCYLVTKKSANTILNYHKNNLTVADNWGKYFENTDINIYLSNILKHPIDLTNSTIEQERVNKKYTFSLLGLISKVVTKSYRLTCVLQTMIQGNQKIRNV